MKMTVILSIIAIALVSAKSQARPADNKNTTAEELGRDVLESFKKQSPGEFVLLFPTLPELHQLMQKNAEVYDVFLGIAMEDFSKTYYEKVMPQLNTAFEKVVADGIEMGIDWASVEFVGVNELTKGEDTSTIQITFDAMGKKFLLEVEQLNVNGQRKVTQFINLS